MKIVLRRKESHLIRELLEKKPQRSPSVLHRSPKAELAALYQSVCKKSRILKREIKGFMDRVGKQHGVDYVRELLLE